VLQLTNTYSSNIVICISPHCFLLWSSLLLPVALHLPPCLPLPHLFTQHSVLTRCVQNMKRYTHYFCPHLDLCRGSTAGLKPWSRGGSQAHGLYWSSSILSVTLSSA
jgi:hypothetical protein